MSKSKLIDLIEKFDPNANGVDPSTNWYRWKRQIVWYIKRKKTDEEQKVASLLWYGGPILQGVYEANLTKIKQAALQKSITPLMSSAATDDGSTSDQTEEQKGGWFEEVLKIFDKAFTAVANPLAQMQILLKTTQAEGESILEFSNILQMLAGNAGLESIAKEQIIRQQLLLNCNLDELKRRIIPDRLDEKPLEDLLELAYSLEQSERFTKPAKKETVNAVIHDVEKRTFPAWKEKKQVNCSRCGWESHQDGDPKCPAKGETCRKCNRTNHFARMCKSQTMTSWNNVNAKRSFLRREKDQRNSRENYEKSSDTVSVREIFEQMKQMMETLTKSNKNKKKRPWEEVGTSVSSQRSKKKNFKSGANDDEDDKITKKKYRKVLAIQESSDEDDDDSIGPESLKMGKQKHLQTLPSLRKSARIRKPNLKYQDFVNWINNYELPDSDEDEEGINEDDIE